MSRAETGGYLWCPQCARGWGRALVHLQTVGPDGTLSGYWRPVAKDINTLALDDLTLGLGMVELHRLYFARNGWPDGFLERSGVLATLTRIMENAQDWLAQEIEPEAREGFVALSVRIRSLLEGAPRRGE